MSSGHLVDNEKRPLACCACARECGWQFGSIRFKATSFLSFLSSLCLSVCLCLDRARVFERVWGVARSERRGKPKRSGERGKKKEISPARGLQA